jgi:UDP-N-acetylmuramoyl-tripeptide--D-alanyl-D-alanine ligase
VAANAFDGAQHQATMDDLIESVRDTLPLVRSVLVKGSRFMRMERVVDALAPLVASSPVQEERRHAE